MPAKVFAQAVVEAPAHPTQSQLERARQSFHEGMEAADHGRWPLAALAFEESYRRSGNPVALFNWASASREAGQAEQAHRLTEALLSRHASALAPDMRVRAEALLQETAPQDPEQSGASPSQNLNLQVQPELASVPARAPAEATPNAPPIDRPAKEPWPRRRLVWIGVATVVLAGASTALALSLRGDETNDLPPPAGVVAVYRMP